MQDTYKTISSKIGEGFYSEKRSKFLAFAHHVSSLDEIKQLLAAYRKKYYDARHCCYAYMLGPQRVDFRANDDGEPSSSAGRPILGQIDSNGLSDILIVVVRYFGGIKLGIPGLIRAYKTSSSDAISNAEIVTKIASRRYSLNFGYMAMNDVMRMVKDLGLEQKGQDFGTECRLDLSVRLSAEKDFLDRVSKIQGCSVTCKE